MNRNGCEELGILISRYVDSETSAEERVRVEEHLAECPPCTELLAIFQRNDRMLSGSVAEETFGRGVLEGVMSNLEAETVVAEVARPFEWRRWIPPAAAAAVILAFLGGLFIANPGRNDSSFSGYVAGLQATNESLLTLTQDLQRANNDRIQSKVLDRATDRTLAFFSGNARAIKIAAKFANPERYVSYSIHRRPESETAWTPLETGLIAPEYEDKDVLPGKIYWYRFHAHPKTGDPISSVHQRAMLSRPDQVDPRKCVRIVCADAKPEHGVAKFRLTRYVNENPVDWVYTLHPGETLGAREEVPGVGPVDFSTGLMLDGLEEDDQSFTMELNTPKFDEGTGLALEDEDGNPVSQLEQKTIATRKNSKTILRHPSKKSSVTIWMGESAYVPLP